MPSEHMQAIFKEFGVPLAFAIIFMGAIYLMYEDNKELTNKVIELGNISVASVDNNSQMIAQAIDRGTFADKEAAAQREKQTEYLKLHQETLRQIQSDSRTREKETEMRVRLFIHAINRLTREQGKDPLFPEPMSNNEE